MIRSFVAAKRSSSLVIRSQRFSSSLEKPIPKIGAVIRRKSPWLQVKPNPSSVSDFPFESFRKHVMAVSSEFLIRRLSLTRPSFKGWIERCVRFTQRYKALWMRRLLQRHCGFSDVKQFDTEKALVSFSKVMASLMLSLLSYSGGALMVQRFPSLGNGEVRMVRNDFRNNLEDLKKETMDMDKSLRKEMEEKLKKMEEEVKKMEEEVEKMKEEVKKMEEEVTKREEDLKSPPTSSWWKWF